MKIYNQSEQFAAENGHSAANSTSSSTQLEQRTTTTNSRQQTTFKDAKHKKDVLGESPNLIKSQIRFDAPPENTNMARELWQAFKLHSSRVLLVDAEQEREWSGAELLQSIGRIATNLVLGPIKLRPNDVVMTICEHTGVEILAALGSVVAGAGLYGTSPQDGYNEVKVLCELARPNVIIVNSRLHERALALRQNVQGLQDVRIVWIDNPIKSTLAGRPDQVVDENNNNNDGAELESIIERDQVILFDEHLMNGGLPMDEQLIESLLSERIKAKEHVLTYMLTSGSTGRPKVVQSTHEELVYGMYSMISASRYSIGSAGDAVEVNENNNISGDSEKRPTGCLLPVGLGKVCSGDLPLDHGAGLNTMFLALIVGAKYVVMPAYDVDSFWQAVQDYRITTSVSSTTFGYKLFARLKQLIDAQETHKWDISSLEFISFAGAKLACLDLVGEVTKVYKHLRVSQSYGCTEIGFISMVHPEEANGDYLKSTGYLFPGLLAKIVDPDQPDADNSDKCLGPNQLGELCIWAQSKFKAYKCHPSDDGEQIFRNCHDSRGVFYRTGDQAHIDSEGRLYIHGRFKDTLFLMEDWKILPIELEQVINEHPLVEMSAVVGKPNPELPGCHKPKAFVKLVDLKALTGEAHQEQQLVEQFRDKDMEFICKDIARFVADRTAQPKHLTGGVQVVDEFPRVGLLNKVDRKALARMDD